MHPKHPMDFMDCAMQEDIREAMELTALRSDAAGLRKELDALRSQAQDSDVACRMALRQVDALAKERDALAKERDALAKKRDALRAQKPPRPRPGSVACLTQQKEKLEELLKRMTKELLDARQALEKAPALKPCVGRVFCDPNGGAKASSQTLLVAAGIPPTVACAAEAHVPSPLRETLVRALVLSCMVAEPQKLRASLTAEPEHRARALKRARFVAHPDKNLAFPGLSTEAAKVVNSLC